MADGPPGAAARGDAIGLRLALAFLGVALAAVALLAGLTAAFAAADVSSLASRQVAKSPGFPPYAHGAQLSRPIVVQGERVGTAVVRFTGSGLGGADEAL